MKYYFVSYNWDKIFQNYVIDVHPLEFQINEQKVGNNIIVIAYQEITEEEYLKFVDLIDN